MKLNKKITFTLFILSILGTKAYSQITIGSSEPPVQGALLQLTDITGATGGQANATKGLLLPRVKLIKETDDTNVASTISGATGTYDPTSHIGLMVYNVNNDPCPMVKPGAYTWNGDTWQALKKNGPDPLESETATTVTDRQGNVYPIANFGEAGIWMTENLRTTSQPGNKKVVEQGFISTNMEMYYVYPQANTDRHLEAPEYWRPEYGLLYNWSAATNNDNCTEDSQTQLIKGDYINNDPIQGICPYGWHLPSDGEWNLLQKTVSQNASLYSDHSNGVWNTDWEITSSSRTGGIDGSVIKSKTKIKTIGNVDVPNPTNGYSNSATENGFNALLVGEADSFGNSMYGEQAYFWTGSVYLSILGCYRNFTDTNPNGFRSGLPKSRYFSVRCKKN